MINIEAIGAIAGDAVRTTDIGAARGTGADFMKLLGEGVTQADQSLKAADTQLRGLAAGQDIAVHDVMIALEKARMDLMLVVEVRNRVLEGYQELMRMQL